MAILLLGLFLFITAHSLTFLARGTRAKFISVVGEPRWQGFVSVASLVGMALIVWGYSLARVEPVQIYVPATWVRHVSLLIMLTVFPLLFATYLPGRIQSAAVHPTLMAVTLWSFAHLLANGTLPDVILFWSFFIWSVSHRASYRYRPAPPIPGAGPSKYNDLIAVGGGLAIYVLFLLWVHAWLFGVSPLGAAAS